MNIGAKFKALLQDPPPQFAFEIASDGVAMARTDAPSVVQFAALPDGTMKPNPVSDNVIDPAAYAQAVTKLIPTGLRGRQGTALILPDNSVRVAILDFDTVPEKDEERRALIRFRLRKTLPFDVDTSTVSYTAIAAKRFLVAVAPNEIIAQYEAPFRALGLHPGLVTVSSVSMLELMPPKVSAIIAKLSAGVLTVTALQSSGILLIRSLDLDPNATDPLDEISDDLYPTLAYIEDTTGSRPEKLLIAGFGDESVAVSTRLAIELELPVEAIPEKHPGLLGYLATLPAATKPTAKKVAA